MCKFLKVGESPTTAQKTVFPGSWNIMESSKRPSKYYLYINFLAKKRPYFSSQNRNFLVAQNKNFSVISKCHLSITFLSQKKQSISHFRKVQNDNFSVISKHQTSINFFGSKIPYFLPRKIQNKGSLAASKRCSMLKKISLVFFCCFFFFLFFFFFFFFLRTEM